MLLVGSLPSLTELDLTCNLISSWGFVEDLCAALPGLKVRLGIIGSQFICTLLLFSPFHFESCIVLSIWFHAVTSYYIAAELPLIIRLDP